MIQCAKGTSLFIIHLKSLSAEKLITLGQGFLLYELISRKWVFLLFALLKTASRSLPTKQFRFRRREGELDACYAVSALTSQLRLTPTRLD